MLKFLPSFALVCLLPLTSLQLALAQDANTPLENSEVSPEDSTESAPETVVEESETTEASDRASDEGAEADTESASGELASDEAEAIEESETSEAEDSAKEQEDSEVAVSSGLQTVIEIPLKSGADRFDVIDRQGQKLAVLGLLQEQSVAIVDLQTGETLAQTAVGFEPNTVRYDGTNNVVYAAGIKSEGLVVLEADTLEIRKGYGLGAGVLDLDFDGETGRIFATHPSISSISVMSLSEEQARTLPVPRPPLAIAFNPVSKNLLITTRNEDPLGVLVLNAENGELLALLRSGIKPEDIALEPTSQRVVVLNSDTSDLTSFNRRATGEAIQTIGLNWRPTRIALSPDGRKAYVTSRDSNHLQVANLETGSLEAIYDLEDSPIGIHYLPTDRGPALLIAEAGEPQLRWLQLPEVAPEDVASLSLRPNSGSAAGRIVDLAGNEISGGGADPTQEHWGIHPRCQVQLVSRR